VLTAAAAVLPAAECTSWLTAWTSSAMAKTPPLTPAHFQSARPSEPQLATDAAVEAALSRLMTVAAGRLVVLINPRLGGDSAILESFEPAYFMRPLSLAYLKDQYAKQVDRVRCCLVRCYPHEWSVLYESEGAWRYAGRFEQQPLAEELEAKLRESITKERNGRLRQQEQGAGES